ncbi:MAG: hypothetical protein FWH01_01175 [Oscillospiraceae bacterium]|nr:hypothetical protein [Oscillospiraceae bacterium]
MTSVDLVTGLLGAGKTTFIKEYIGYLKRRGIDPVVIENEFGREGVDTAMLRDTGAPVSELTGGCICCGLKLDFIRALEELSGAFERIIVEPSGVFTLGDFFEAMSAPAIKRCCVVGGVVTVVDGSAQRHDAEERALYEAQVRGTGAILLNRGATCETFGSGAPVFIDGGLTDDGLYEGGLSDGDIEKIIAAASAGGAGYVKAEIDHARIYQSCSVQIGGQFSHDSVEQAVRRLFAPEFGEVLRVKGTIGGVMANATNSAVELSRGGGEPMLNIIGRKLNRKAILRSLSDALPQ